MSFLSKIKNAIVGRIAETYADPYTLTDLATDLDSTIVTNLINIDDPDGGISADKYVTGYIAVSSDTEYTCSSANTLDAICVRQVAYYNSSKVLLSTLDFTNTFTTPATCRYIIVNLYNDYVTTYTDMYLTAMIEQGSVAHRYTKGLTSYRPINFSSVLAGGIFSSYGDSITEQNQWQYHIIREFGGMTHERKGVGGTAISGASVNSMNDDARIATLNAASTLLTLMGGTNDFGGSVALGTPTSVDIATFYGAVNVTIAKMQDQCPLAKLVILTPPYQAANPDWGADGWVDEFTNAAGVTLRDYADVLIDRAEAFGLLYVDIYSESGIDANTESNLLADKTHPNIKGGWNIAQPIIKALTGYDIIS